MMMMMMIMVVMMMMIIMVVYYRVSNATVSVANVENAHHSTRYVS